MNNLLTAAELRAARIALGQAEGFARLVGVDSGRTVRRWEAGERGIPGPVQVLTTAFMSGRAVRRHFEIDGWVRSGGCDDLA
jgi:DNA-binding transcriptional regulator YiaG